MAAADAPVVVTVGRGTCVVRLPQGQDQHCELAGEIAKVQKRAVAVGDRVRVEERADAPPLVVEVLPRRTLLSRPDPMDPRLQRAVVANVDVVAIVVATRRPTFKPRLVDCFLVAVHRGGPDALIVLNKADLVKPRRLAELRESLRPYEEIDVPVVVTAAPTATSSATSSGQGLDELREALRGRTAAFVGHSGVGKSSLLNGLLGRSAIEVGDVRRGDGKGRHTTTFSALHELGEGTRIVDTPGIRAFGLWGMSREELRHSFPEFAALRCRYVDCVHDAEPEADCGVKQAVASGAIPAVRYRTYLGLLEGLDA